MTGFLSGKEAIVAMKYGKKVTHKAFFDNEYINE